MPTILTEALQKGWRGVSTAEAGYPVMGNAGDGSMSHTCIGIASNTVDCHNAALYALSVICVSHGVTGRTAKACQCPASCTSASITSWLRRPSGTPLRTQTRRLNFSASVGNALSHHNNVFAELRYAPIASVAPPRTARGLM